MQKTVAEFNISDGRIFTGITIYFSFLLVKLYDTAEATAEDEYSLPRYGVCSSVVLVCKHVEHQRS
jgi:hypothetical protein